MITSPDPKGYLWAGVLLAALFLALAVGKIVFGLEEGPDVRLHGRFWVNVIYLIPPVMMTVGLGAQRRSHNWSMGVVVPLALVFMLFGVDSVLIGINEGWPDATITAGLGALGAALFLAGLWISRRSPQTGRALTVVGAVPMGLIMWWTLIPPVLALALAVFGVRRAGRFAENEAYRPALA